MRWRTSLPRTWLGVLRLALGFLGGVPRLWPGLAGCLVVVPLVQPVVFVLGVVVHVPVVVEESV